MFKKKCSRCKSKIKDDYEFCPFCGHNLNSSFDKEDYGLLGKNDEFKQREPNLFEGLGFGGISFGKLIKSAMKELPSMMKMIEKQMEESLNQDRTQNLNKPNVQLFINGKRVESLDAKNSKDVEKIQKNIPQDKMKKLSKFPKVEPKSEVRRLSGRVVYNLSVPGVKSLEDIFINQLENSIEIKAISEDKVYSKTLNLNLPLKGYNLIKENLVLELGAE